MKLKIITTTDRKYIGEVLEVESLSNIGDTVAYKDTEFTIVGMTIKGNIITLNCPNYIAKFKILEE